MAKPKKIQFEKCIVLNCQNQLNRAVFRDDMCPSCHEFVTTGRGTFSQAYRNSLHLARTIVAKSVLGGIVQLLGDDDAPPGIADIELRKLMGR